MLGGNRKGTLTKTFNSSIKLEYNVFVNKVTTQNNPHQIQKSQIQNNTVETNIFG